MRPAARKRLQRARRSLDRAGVQRSLVPFARRSAGPRRTLFIIASLLVIVLAMVGTASADALDDLEKAHNAYVAHKYDDAEARLRALLDPKSGTLKDADSIADARMYLAAVLLAKGKKDEANKVLEQLLLDKPDYQADPLRVSLEAVDVLTDVRSRLRDRLAAIQSEKVRAIREQQSKIETERQRAALRLAMLEKLASEELVIERHSRWIAILPFGVGQFQNGQNELGWVLLTGESLLGIGSVIGAALTLYYSGQANDALRQGEATTAHQYEDRAVTSQIVGDAFVIGLGVVGLAGVIHAQLTFVPERTQARKRALPPLSLAPVLLPMAPTESGGGAVVGIAGRF